MNLKKNLIALSTASVVAIAGAGVATADEAVQADDTQQQAVTIDDAATANTAEDVAEEVTEEAAEDVAEGDDAAEVAEETVEEGDTSSSSSSSEDSTADETESTDEGATAGSSEDSTADETPAGSSDEDFFKWDEETTGVEKFQDVAELLSIIGGVIATIVTLVALF